MGEEGPGTCPRPQAPVCPAPCGLRTSGKSKFAPMQYLGPTSTKILVTACLRSPYQSVGYLNPAGPPFCCASALPIPLGPSGPLPRPCSLPAPRHQVLPTHTRWPSFEHQGSFPGALTRTHSGSRAPPTNVPHVSEGEPRAPRDTGVQAAASAAHDVTLHPGSARETAGARVRSELFFSEHKLKDNGNKFQSVCSFLFPLPSSGRAVRKGHSGGRRRVDRTPSLL